MRIAARLARMGGKTGARYAGLTTIERSGPLWTGEIRVAEDLLGWPLFQRRPRRVAVNMMSDLFHENIPTATVDLLHAVMGAAHWHRFLVLTKRSDRMRAYYSDPETRHRIANQFDLLTTAILPGPRGRSRSPRLFDPALSRAQFELWPQPNLWLGVSVEDQDRIGRIRELLQTPAAIRWVCFEPLLDRVSLEAVPVDQHYFDALKGGHYSIDGRGRRVSREGPAWGILDWVVTGGEIGSGARSMHPRWVRRLRDSCVAATIPFFFSRWGEWAPVSEAAADQTMSRVGRRAAGRLLDGRTWDEIPPM
jgi:protein gp37